MKILDYKTHLEQMANQVEEPEFGFFGPGSMAWKVNREGVIAMGALRALLMQVAHPKVAQGVADHSQFRTKPLSRAYKTMHAQQTIVFGTVDQAVEILMQIYARHAVVRGNLPYGDRDAYIANDPILQLWVHATLVDSVMRAYNTFLPQLTREETDQFYRESCLFAKLIGIPEEVIPPTLQEFNIWVEKITTSNQIKVSPTGREIGESLLRLPLPIFWPTNYLLAAGSLPENLRQDYGLKWTSSMKAVYDVGVGVIGGIASRLPLFLRATPPYWRAVRRTN